MKKITLIIAVLLSAVMMAQVTNEGKPLSWDFSADIKVDQISLLPIDLNTLMQEDAINDHLQGIPYRVGVPIEAPYNIHNSGTWTTLDNGDKIWQIAINSPGAVQMSVNFDQFYMPKGAKLYLHNESKSDLLGAYTSVQNQESGVLGTWFVKGDKLWIEYYEPQNVAGLGKLSIENIIHCYRFGDEHQSKQKLNNSGDCNHDVDCPIGADWEDYKEINKRTVAFLSMGNGYICTGGLVNNTANDGTPYFLTANHCYSGSNPASWSMRFKWISPNPICAQTTNSSQGPTYMTISGTTLRAKNAATDFCLVELNSNPPSGWDLDFAGWDKTDTTPDFVVGIHHPSGDIMKICRDDTGVIKKYNAGAQTWEITTAGGGWELGVTEGGSSGSPLFDDLGRVVGQLYGGAAACNGTNDNGQYDFYGRFGVSWDGSSSSTRLKDWLDPLSLDPDYIDSYSTAIGIAEIFSDKVSIYPNPTEGMLSIVLKNFSGKYLYTITSILGQQVISGALTQPNSSINLSHLNEGVYLIEIADSKGANSLIRKIIINK